jgi:hypothetical protein
MYGEFDKARLFFGDVVEETKLSTESAITREKIVFPAGLHRHFFVRRPIAHAGGA